MNDLVRMRAELRLWRFGAALIAGSVLLGLIQAFVWAALAPGEQYQVGTDGGYGALPTESVHRFTSIAIFVLLGIVTGICAGVAAWGVRSVRGPQTLGAVGLAGGVGALTAYLIGKMIAPGTDPASIGASAAARLVHAPPVLGNAMVLIIQPAFAVGIYTLLVLWNGHPDLDRPDRSLTPVDQAGAMPRRDR